MSQQVRVLVLTPDFPPATGGIQRLVHRLVKSWERVEARVVAPSAAQAAAFDTAEALDVRRVRAPSRLGHRVAMVLLNSTALGEAHRFKPQVLLNAHVVTGPAGWMIHRTEGVPFVQYLHGREVVDRPRMARFALRHAAAAVAVSRYTESLAYACGARPDKLHRIPPGVDLPGASPRERAQRPTVVTVARLEHRYKGHDMMIRALARVRERIPDVLWIVIGQGSLRKEYEQLVHREGLDAHVRFIGSVTDSERDAWLDRAHLFAMPSRVMDDGGGEGFGIVYLEAAAHGLPVIAGNAAGAPDAVIDGKTGKLVEPTDHISLADAISELLLDRAQAQSLGRAGEARARDFSWARIARRVEDVLLDLADR